MLELKTVQTVHYVMRGLYSPVPDPELTYIDLAEAVAKAAAIKAANPDELVYVETRSFIAVLGA